MLQSRIFAACILCFDFGIFVALAHGSRLNGYSITYVTYSLRASSRGLEWVWNSADYCRSRQFQVHVTSITNKHLIAIILILIWGILTFASLVPVVIAPYFHIYIYISFHHPHCKIIAKCKSKTTCWKHRNLTMYYIIAVLNFAIHYIFFVAHIL